MKLESAVKMGRFCGLNTVEVCIFNVQRHVISLFPYTEMETELKELYKEYEEYEKGNITLDFEAIDKENKEVEEEYFKEMENQEPPSDEDLELF